MENSSSYKLDAAQYQEVVRILESHCCSSPEYNDGATAYCLKGGGSAQLTIKMELTTKEIKDDALRSRLNSVLEKTVS